MSSVRSASVSLPGGEFAYLEAGGIGAPLVLCLHGFPDHAPTFEPLIEGLARVGYRAVAPWMRGYAPTTTDGPFDVERLADDVRELAEALAPGRPITAIGHDWGAVAIYRAAVRFPELFASAVTMAVPHPAVFLRALLRNPRQLRRSWYMFFFQLPALPELALARGLAERLWRSWSPGFELGESERRRLMDCLTRSGAAPIEYYRAMFRIGPNLSRRIRELEASIEVPTLYLHGDRDRCIGVEATRGQMHYFSGPFEQELLAQAGHFLQLEVPERVLESALRWLKVHPPPAR
jgi:pimeloyl-ACP methyl ester carboxylesterase